MPIKSAWASKINWAQAIAAISVLLAMFGIQVPDEVKAQIVAVIAGVTFVATWVMRTYFTNTAIKAAPPSAASRRAFGFLAMAALIVVAVAGGGALSGCAVATQPILPPGISAAVAADLQAARAALPVAQAGLKIAEGFGIIPASIQPTLDKLSAQLPQLLDDAAAAAAAGDAVTVEAKITAFTNLAEEIAKTIADYKGDASAVSRALDKVHGAQGRLQAARVATLHPPGLAHFSLHARAG